MTSLLSGLSVLVLVFGAGCFSLPMVEQYPSTMSTPQYGFGITVGSVINDPNKITMKLMSDQEAEKIPDIKKPRSEDIDPVNAAQPDIDDNDNVQIPVDNVQNPVDNGNVPNTVDAHPDDELAPRYPDLLERALRGKKQEDEEDEEIKREFTTSNYPSFMETSSMVAPHLYTSEPQISSAESFGQYTGLLADDVHVPKKSNKVQSLNVKAKTSLTTLTTPNKVKDDASNEDSNAPVLQLEQNSSGLVPNVKSQILQLEDNNVTPGQLPQDIQLNSKLPQKTLAQGKQSVQLKKTKSNN
jgi:hypothetical protein